MINSFSDFLSYLKKREMFGIKLGLENINRLLSALGHPERKFRCIHIAGSNGKGSVAAMISSILTKAGIKSGLYTSPHLINITERIRFNDSGIPEKDLLDTANKVIPYATPEITYFEIFTAIAIQYFADKGVDIAIMETGMGGRLDATNACFGEIAIITDLCLEHTDYLGNTIEKIRSEKHGILKQGSIAIKAEDLKLDYDVNERTLDYQIVRIDKYEKIKLKLLGDHQIRNCALVLKTIEVLNEKGYNISLKSMYSGLETVNWPARFQVVLKKPLTIIDGAHNPAAVNVLIDTVEKYLGQYKTEQGIVTLVIGILKDKNYKEMIKCISKIAKAIITVTPKNDRALQGEDLKQIISDNNTVYVQDTKKVIDNLSDYKEPILITGSLYLAGEVLGYLKKR